MIGLIASKFLLSSSSSTSFSEPSEVVRLGHHVDVGTEAEIHFLHHKTARKSQEAGHQLRKLKINEHLSCQEILVRRTLEKSH